LAFLNISMARSLPCLLLLGIVLPLSSFHLLHKLVIVTSLFWGLWSKCKVVTKLRRAWSWLRMNPLPRSMRASHRTNGIYFENFGELEFHVHSPY
jgi:hypothetical protein